MSESINQEKIESFRPEKSHIAKTYVLLNAHMPSELFDKFLAEDQHLMETNAWDYSNQELVVNQVKDILETASLSDLSMEEKQKCKEILWLWYHHAISCAIGKHHDKQAAQTYAGKALEYQPENHPNKITRLLDLLVNDKVKEAEQWAQGIEDKLEKNTADLLLENYKKGKW